MKYWTRSFFLALVFTTGAAVQSQTLEQSRAAFARDDYRTAVAGFRKLAEKGNPDAQFYLGTMYNDGQGMPKDEQQALKWFRKAADRGVPGAQFSLGWMYGEGEGVAKDDQQAVTWYRKAAEQGHVVAQYNLGAMYSGGQGVPHDEQQAAAWVRKAADGGLAAAQVRLGQRYENGIGVPKDDQQAVTWYRKAAENGNVEAQNALAIRYLVGHGVAQDQEQAAAWYRRAAEQGDASGQNSLGSMYQLGHGVPQDQKQAAAWYRRAAEQGDSDGQNSLGLMYVEGNGVLKDEQQAVAWYRRAAEQGNTMAQHNLGLQYYRGEGVPKDSQVAYFWWLLASAEGGREDMKLRDIEESAMATFGGGPTTRQKSMKLRDTVERVLSPEQRAAAQSDARNWKPKTAAQSKGSFAASGGLEPSPSRQGPASSQADSTGSGFRVARGTIVTNHHVINGCSRLRVNGVAAQVGGSDARSDLALLRATLPGPSTSLRARRVSVGEPVAVAGYPLHGLLSGFNMTTGSLSSLSGMGGDTRLVQITAPVQPGNSGGPVLDSAGNLMGVVVSKLDAIKAAKLTGDIPQNVNFAINANVLRSFLDANSVEYETANSDKALLSTAIAEKAKGFTVLVECWK